MNSTQITADELRSRLEYDPETGLFKWKNLTRKRSHATGWFAGSKNMRGYLNIKINRVLYQAHRLAWLYMHGAMPSNVIDHINRDSCDNRISNLRDVPQGENLKNRGAYRKRQKSPEVLA